MSIRSAGANDYLTVEPETEFTEDTYSVIDRHSSFDGTFHSDRDLRIDGEVKGTIECQGTLFVAEGATVNARIQAENITVAGDLTGDIDCRGRLRLLPSAIMKGKVKTRALVIAQGAVYDGELSMESIQTVPSIPQETPPRVETTQAPRSQRPNRQQTRPAVEPAPSSAEPAAPSTFIRRLGGPETPWDEQAAAESEQASAAEE